MLSPQQKASNIASAARAAYGAEFETGCPAELTLAQWALESGFGEHAPGNNPFGIKALSGYPSQKILTTEERNGQKYTRYQEFAKFPTAQEAFEEHGKLIMRGDPYRFAVQRYLRENDLDAFIAAVAKRYATAENYAQALEGYRRLPEIEAALAEVKCPAKAA